MSTGPYGRTSGTEVRESRPVMERLMAFSLADELDRLRSEQPWQEGERNSRTLAKDIDFRVLLSVLRAGAELQEEDGDARVSLQLLDGQAQLQMDDAEADLDQGDLAVVDAGHRWRLRAASDCALLLTLSWPREKARA